ncbi:MAG TPA: gephyrin-like molybdotransferase Glp [Anaerolineaceae bacterium]|nr:gephyrin-like molybdotransferase Glp [Anaerolineaceae bacterium]
MSELLSVTEAQQRILSAFQPVGSTRVPLLDAGGRVLAADVSARLDLPPFSNSSVDGFAVRTADIRSAAPGQPVELAVIADIPAGSYPTFTLQPGQAARIMTGAPVPAGADAIIPVEQTNFPYREFTPELPKCVQIFSSAAEGNNVRPKGQDVRAGQLLLEHGRRLKPQDVGILASIGIPHVEVYRRPRVALVSTGDELLSPDQPLTPGKIYDSNSYVLAALLEQYGAEPVRLGFSRDQPELVRDILTRAMESDVQLILTSAGVSVGPFDFVRSMIEQHGELAFWRVNMRPGKPLTFGRFHDTPLIGLPGNPVSAFVGFQVFVVPVLRKLAGLPEPRRQIVRATIADSIEGDGRETYYRAIVRLEDGQFVARLTGHQGSGNLFSLVQANALLIVPSGVKSCPVGAQLDAWLLDPELTD